MIITYRWFLVGRPRSVWVHTPSRRRWRPPRCHRSVAPAAEWASPDTKPRGPEGKRHQQIQREREKFRHLISTEHQHSNSPLILESDGTTYHILVDEVSHKLGGCQALLLENKRQTGFNTSLMPSDGCRDLTNQRRRWGREYEAAVDNRYCKQHVHF